MSTKPYDPNAAGQTNSGIFGLPYSVEEAQIVILPAPWDVTTSYRPGTHGGPQAILEESPQLDLFHPKVKDLWKKPIAIEAINLDINTQNQHLRGLAEQIITALEAGESHENNQQLINVLTIVNQGCEQFHLDIQIQLETYLNQGKKVILLGGDHSTPLGALKALSKKHSSFGILQIDAHMDLRNAYEGFVYSHASIMYNALTQISEVSQLVQVGIRDYCEDEVTFAISSQKVRTFFDRDLKAAQFEGKHWKEQVEEIVSMLPSSVYVTIDIDGLTPELCPNTGTPVPGGLRFEELVYLLDKLKASGKSIIGADLVEVGNSPWDAMVGARVLFELWALLS